MLQVHSHRDFIGIYDEAISHQECNNIIEQFKLVERNQSNEIHDNEHLYGGPLKRKDFCVFAEKHVPDVHKFVSERLHECLLHYCEHFFTVKDIPAASLEVKLQRTPPRGGYHIWHCEQDCQKHANRVLVWTIYLNDIPYNEGETEFLWQGVRVNPKAGRCAIWPAAFTHTHRGNPVYTCDKYIATGWYTLI
jgi:hypothetical protein